LTLDVVFNLLNSELENAYGQTIDWEEVALADYLIRTVKQ
jgi:hypothetical protein